MPLVSVRRKGVSPSIRRMPVSTCAVVMPMTFDRVGNETTSDIEEPAALESLREAFEKFAPLLAFCGTGGDPAIEFRAEFHFRSIRDFDPECLQKHQEFRGSDGTVRFVRNDLAALKGTIDLVYRIKDRFEHPLVRRAWCSPQQRQSIIEALANLRLELMKVAAGLAGKPKVIAGGESTEADVLAGSSGRELGNALSPKDCKVAVPGVSRVSTEAPEAGNTIATSTVNDILVGSAAREIVQEIFGDLHPGFLYVDREIASIFTPDSAEAFLRDVSTIDQFLSVDDQYDETLAKFQAQIDTAEHTRDELLAKIFQWLRPIERSYREVMLFFENAKPHDDRPRKPTQLYIFNADPKVIRDPSSLSLRAIGNFVKSRNDNFNFRDDICNLVIPGYLPKPTRDRVESMANEWGLLFIGDIDDEKSFKNVERQFQPGGKYEFLKRPEDRTAADVVTMGYLCLRPAHWFERHLDNAGDLYGPPSLVFAAAIARADDAHGLAQGPVGSRFGQIAGVDRCRIEPLIGEIEHLSMERQLIPIIRNADNQLCFFGCRTSAEDPYGAIKLFTPYRIVRYIERCCRQYLLQAAGHVLTRDFMDEAIEKPLKKLLDSQVEQGAIFSYRLDVDKDSNKRMQGICDVSLELMPTGPGEAYVLKLDIPEFFKRDLQKK